MGRGRYSEPDVAALARMLTGWSYYRPWEAATGVDGATMSNRGQFVYRPLWHEEGPVTFMGKVYPDDGMKQAQRALTDLAGRTETAENIAFKLVRHFITDKPTPAMADPIKRVFLRTGGDLKAVSLALLDLPEAWSAPLAKLRTPYELEIAKFRALGVRYTSANYWVVTKTLEALHQPIWACLSPEGFSDDTLDWLTPDGIANRVESALLAARAFGADLKLPVLDLSRRLYDRALSSATSDAIARAYTPALALTILFACPEFQRR
ncbi:MAG: DUF1800 family protein [Rhizobiales bacterium]|nr:DUF1800 family protein [Hyphomicrobiales bacterium]